MFKIASVDFPFVEDPTRTKRRPVLCLTDPIGRHQLIIIAYMTTKTEENLETNILLNKQEKGFVKTGLGYTSAIKLHKITSIHASDIQDFIGVLPEKHSKEVKESLKKMFKL